MALEITWPRAHNSASLGNTIVASGWADEPIVGVIGEWRSTSDPASSVECPGVNFFMGGGGEKNTPRYRWAIVLKPPGPGKYVLTVTGLGADGKLVPETASVGFTVALGVATITYPASYQDITLEASNLFAYGDLIGYPLGLLELKNSSGTVIQPTSVDSDYVILEYWCASYPPLSPGLYSLRVQDVNGNGEISTDVYVGV